MALIRFQVQDEDMFGDPNFLGQAVYPVPSIRKGGLIALFKETSSEADLLSGYRSVTLKNGYNEELELSSLVIHVDIRNAKVLQISQLHLS